MNHSTRGLRERLEVEDSKPLLGHVGWTLWVVRFDSATEIFVTSPLG